MATGSAPVRIIGVDPGKTTGLAILDLAGGAWFTEMADAAGVPHNLRVMIRAGDLVAAEKFVVSRRAGRSSSAKAGEQARDILGALREICRENGAQFVTYPAVVVKRWAADKRLKAAGLHAPTKGIGHARDAARHALHAARWHAGLPDPLSSAWRERFRFDQ